MGSQDSDVIPDQITFYFCTTLKSSIPQILEVILKLDVLPVFVYVARK